LSNTLRPALVGWSKTLSAEVGRDGVTVNVLLPGRIHTELVDEIDGMAAKRQESRPPRWPPPRTPPFLGRYEPSGICRRCRLSGRRSGKLCDGQPVPL
jgi:NAD(P)-dependent dehydrogenase (short-subunit alcohol dehydrogenase family)